VRSVLVLMLVLVLPLAGCLDASSRPGDLPLHDALLLSDPYPVLIVEIDHVEGLEPHPDALAAVREALETYTEKEQVIFLGPQAIPAQGDAHTPDGLKRIHRLTADLAPTAPGVHGRDGVAFLHVLYLDGQLERQGEPSHAAGTQFDAHGLLVVFPETFRDAHRILDGRSVAVDGDVERVVLLHELGHSLGLVDDGIPTLRPHGGGGHSTNPQSVMYPRVPITEDGLVQRALPRGFDADDQADLRAYVAAHSLG